MFLTALLCLIVVILSAFYLYYFSKTRPFNFPPGPPRLPFWGSYWFILKENYHYSHLALESLGKKYKTDILGFYLGDAPAIVTFSNKLNKALLTKEEFSGRNDILVNKERAMGTLRGVLLVDGDFWKQQRRFSLRHLRDYGFDRRSTVLEDLLEYEIKKVMNLLREEPQACNMDFHRKRGEVLLPDLFYGILLHAIFMILSSSKYEDAEMRKLGRAALRFQRSGDTTGGALNITPWLRFIAPKFFGYTSILEDNGELLKFLITVFEEHKKTFLADDCRDYIDEYLQKQLREIDEEITQSNFTDEQLIITLLDYMFPTANAIGHTLSFYFAHISENLEIQQKIQSEIDNVVGRSRLPTLDDRKNMPYTEASVKEVLRIAPINPLGVPRRCTVDTCFAGYFIPKNTVVFSSPWSAHRDKTVWTQPEKFMPERYLTDDDQLTKQDFNVAFGAGKRQCAGETFSRQNMFLIVSCLLQSFTFRPATSKRALDNIIPGVSISLDDNWILAEERQ